MKEIKNKEKIFDTITQLETNQNKRKSYIMYGIGILITSIIIGVGLVYFFKYKQQSNSISALNQVGKTEHFNANKAIFYDLDEFVVNLNKINNHTNFLKTAITFQLKNKEDTAKIESNLPLIKDSFQIYLRELKIEDIQCSAGVFLLKQDLLLRVNQILYPTKIEDVLFRELLTQ